MARQYTRRGVLKTAAFAVASAPLVNVAPIVGLVDLLKGPYVENVETLNKYVWRETPHNFQLTFDRPVSAATAARYVAEVYKRASGDNSVRSTVPCDSVRDDDDLYSIIDGSLRCALFETGSWEKKPARKLHWIYQYHATNKERNLLIKALRAEKMKVDLAKATLKAAWNSLGA